MSLKVGVLTGGGDCPGLNPAIRGVVYRGLDHGFEFVGLEEGWRGLVEGKTLPLGLNEVQHIINQGGTILGTSRTNPFKKEGYVDRCLATWKDLGLDALVAMGGEDTLGVATRLYGEHGLHVVGVPKTMDNDLSATDFTFGFDTAVTLAMEAAERLVDTGRSHRRIMILEVMGRHAGWVALYTGLGAGADWTLLPENPDIDVAAMRGHRDAQDRHAGVGAIPGDVLQIATDARDSAGEELRCRGVKTCSPRGWPAPVPGCGGAVPRCANPWHRTPARRRRAPLLPTHRTGGRWRGKRCTCRRGAPGRMPRSTSTPGPPTMTLPARARTPRRRRAWPP